MNSKFFNNSIYDAVIIGGGFYGTTLANYLFTEKGLRKIIILEKDSSLLKRASYNNQARVHNGYHYPRSFTTAYRSRINLPRFIDDWSGAIKTDFTKLYAIARNNSKVTSKQFVRFCKEIGADVHIASSEHKKLFESRLIEEVFTVKEFAFDSCKLVSIVEKNILDLGIEVIFQAEVKALFRNNIKNCIDIQFNDATILSSKLVFNCTYSGLNQIKGDFRGTKAKLKHEITEMALVRMPLELEGIGVTVMDGPFFSMMPFPARDLYTLSHVRYTPHLNWSDRSNLNPYEKLNNYDKTSRFNRMQRDISRYIPMVSMAEYKESLFEVKTVLAKNEGDDGRPILFEKHDHLPGCYSILGGKIDNIYDIFERLNNEIF